MAAGPGADRFSLAARARSFGHAFRGVAALLASQHNAWIHALATLAVVGTGALAGLSRLEWSVLVLAIAAVWTAEGLNTALEFLCDAVHPERHPLVGRAKDVAAAAVLVAAAGAAVVGVIVLGPPLWARLAG